MKQKKNCLPRADSRRRWRHQRIRSGCNELFFSLSSSSSSYSSLPSFLILFINPFMSARLHKVLRRGERHWCWCWGLPPLWLSVSAAFDDHYSSARVAARTPTLRFVLNWLRILETNETGAPNSKAHSITLIKNWHCSWNETRRPALQFPLSHILKNHRMNASILTGFFLFSLLLFLFVFFWFVFFFTSFVFVSFLFSYTFSNFIFKQIGNWSGVLKQINSRQLTEFHRSKQ